MARENGNWDVPMRHPSAQDACDEEQQEEEFCAADARTNTLLSGLRAERALQPGKYSLRELELAYEKENLRLSQASTEAELSATPAMRRELLQDTRRRLGDAGDPALHRVVTDEELAVPGPPPPAMLERQAPFDLERMATADLSGGRWIEVLAKLGDPLFFARRLLEPRQFADAASSSKDLDLVVRSLVERSLTVTEWKSRVLQNALRYYQHARGTMKGLPTLVLIFVVAQDLFFYLVLRPPEEGEQGWRHSPPVPRRLDEEGLDLDQRMLYAAHYYAPSQRAVVKLAHASLNNATNKRQAT